MNVRSPLTVSRLSGLHRQAGRTDRVPVHMRLNVRATSSRYERALRTTLLSHNPLFSLARAESCPLSLVGLRRGSLSLTVSLSNATRRGLGEGCYRSPLEALSQRRSFFQIVLRCLCQMMTMTFEIRKCIAMVIWALVGSTLVRIIVAAKMLQTCFVTSGEIFRGPQSHVASRYGAACRMCQGRH